MERFLTVKRRWEHLKKHGEEDRSVPEQTSHLKNERMKIARKMSRDIQ
jgi:hypothetical protein